MNHKPGWQPWKMKMKPSFSSLSWEKGWRKESQTWVSALEDEAWFQFFKLQKGLKKGITNLVGRLGRLPVSFSWYWTTRTESQTWLADIIAGSKGKGSRRQTEQQRETGEATLKTPPYICCSISGLPMVTLHDSVMWSLVMQSLVLCYF
jgi:hypothetical protein